MGTYDTIGGTPRHDPAFDEDGSTELQEKIIELLEEAGFRPQAIDQIVAMVAMEEGEVYAEMARQEAEAMLKELDDGNDTTA